jgi:hypothetical protein
MTRPPDPELDPAKPLPPGYHVEEREPSALIPIGGLVLTITYGPAAMAGVSAFYGSSSSCPSDRLLVLPVIGPFAALAGRDDRVGSRCDDPEGAVKGIYGMDGVAQLLGGIFLVAGLSMPEYAVVKDAQAQDATSRGATLRLVPWNAGRSAAGVNLVGRF